jgi:hypothetical protein
MRRWLVVGRRVEMGVGMEGKGPGGGRAYRNLGLWLKVVTY